MIDATLEVVDHEYLVWNISGKLELSDLHEYLPKITELIKGEVNPLPLIVDIEGLNNISMGARKYGIEWLKEGNISRLVVIGASPFLTFMVTKIIALTKMKNDFIMKPTMEEALDWIGNKH